MRRRNALLHAPVTRTLLSLTFPVSLGMLSTFLFQAVDTWFVGKLGWEALAALSFAATMYMLLVGMFIGFSIAVSALVAGAVGAEDRGGAASYAGISLFAVFLGSVFISSAGLFLWRGFFQLIGAEGQILALVGEYIKPLFIGFPLLALGLVGGSILRSHGDVRFPEIGFALAGVVNIVLDRVLIFGVGSIPALGIAGAAWATVVSWAILSALIFLRLFARRHFSGATAEPGRMRILLKTALPAVAAQLIAPLSLLVLTWLASSLGPLVVAALGIAMRMENLLLVGVSSASVAIIPFIASNSGAGDADRVDAGIVFAGKTATYWGVLLFAVLFFLGGTSASLFTDDVQVVAHTRDYFRIVSFSYALLGLATVTAAIFNGMGKTSAALNLLAVKTFAFVLPFAIPASFFGARALFIAIAAGHAAGGIYAAILMRKELKSRNSSLVGRRIWEDYRYDLMRFFRVRK